MRTDGTQIFKLDSALGPYCWGGCLGLSDVIRPIRNTSDGAKLFLHHPPLGQTIYIYSLCGTLLEDGFDLTNTNQSFVEIFPNPSSSSLTFKINPPNNTDEFELVVVDNNAREIKRGKVNRQDNRYSIDTSNLSNGLYYYSLCTKNKSYQSGKFIITK